MSNQPLCPECEAGKHDNCTGWILNEHDYEEPCGCSTCRNTYQKETTP